VVVMTFKSAALISPTTSILREAHDWSACRRCRDNQPTPQRSVKGYIDFSKMTTRLVRRRTKVTRNGKPSSATASISNGRYGHKAASPRAFLGTAICRRPKPKSRSTTGENLSPRVSGAL